jgi:hypothetical protein
MTSLVFSQAKKPTIMIIPADLWMNERGFVIKGTNQGTTTTQMDYEKAFLESSDLKVVINKMQEMMNARNFPTKDLEQVIKELKSESAEDAMLTSRNGANLNETPIDKLKKIAKADITLEIYWKVNSQGPKNSITFTLKGVDAYTNKPVGNAGGTGQSSYQNEISILLEEAVLSYIDNFNFQLQSHFDDLFQNGREIKVRIKVFSNFDGNLETEFSGEELGTKIEKWISENTVKGRFSTTDATENMMLFEQVRIPLYDINGKAIDARNWLKGLQTELKSKYSITSKLMTIGLGEASLVLGDK